VEKGIKASFTTFEFHILPNDIALSHVYIFKYRSFIHSYEPDKQYTLRVDHFGSEESKLEVKETRKYSLRRNI